MDSERLLHTMANELDVIIRQLQSSDPLLRTAAILRLMDFSSALAPHRGRVLSRRAALRAGVAAGFVALSLKNDD